MSAELVKRGYVIDIVSLFPGEEQLADYGLRFISLNANRKIRLIDIVSYKRLAKIVIEGQYDLVQANASDTLKYAVLSKVLFRWKAPLVYRNASMLGMFARGTLKRIYNKWLLSHCDQIISVSENCREDLIKVYQPAIKKSCTIGIGTFDYVGTKAILTDTSSHPIFISVGSLVPEKNHLFILRVFHRYHCNSKSGTLWIVGDGSLRADIEREVTRLGLSKNVKFWGYRRDVIPILKAAHILLIPSFVEGVPGAILEAMSCEVPVIASSVGGIPEIISHNITGICIQEWSEERYLYYINKLISSGSYKEDLVKNARKTFLSNYTIEKVTNEFAERYQFLVKR